MNIGLRIKELRLGLNFKATDFAKKVDISRVYLSEIERGIKNPSLDTLQKICKALNVTPAEFFSTDDDILPPEHRELLQNIKYLTPEQLKLLNALLKTLQK